MVQVVPPSEQMPHDLPLRQNTKRRISSTDSESSESFSSCFSHLSSPFVGLNRQKTFSWRTRSVCKNLGFSSQAECLPNEIWIRILGFLDGQTLWTLGQVSKRFRSDLISSYCAMHVRVLRLRLVGADTRAPSLEANPNAPLSDIPTKADSTAVSAWLHDHYGLVDTIEITFAGAKVSGHTLRDLWALCEQLGLNEENFPCVENLRAASMPQTDKEDDFGVTFGYPQELVKLFAGRFKRIELTGCPVGAHCWSLLSFLQAQSSSLQELVIDVKGAALYQVMGVALLAPQLTSLEFRVTDIYPPEWAYNLGIHSIECRNLKRFALILKDRRHIRRFDYSRLKRFVQCCPHLETLHYDQPIDAEDLKWFARWQKLKSLHFAVHSSDVDRANSCIPKDKWIAFFANTGKHLQELSIRSDFDFETHLIACLPYLPSLKTLDLHQCCPLCPPCPRPGGRNSQSGGRNSQSGGGNSQSGGGNSQSGGENAHSGGGSSQSGGRNSQSGGENAHSGGGSSQSGGGNSQPDSSDPQSCGKSTPRGVNFDPRGSQFILSQVCQQLGNLDRLVLPEECVEVYAEIGAERRGVRVETRKAPIVTAPSTGGRGRKHSAWLKSVSF